MELWGRQCMCWTLDGAEQEVGRERGEVTSLLDIILYIQEMDTAVELCWAYAGPWLELNWLEEVSVTGGFFVSLERHEHCQLKPLY